MSKMSADEIYLTFHNLKETSLLKRLFSVLKSATFKTSQGKGRHILNLFSTVAPKNVSYYIYEFVF